MKITTKLYQCYQNQKQTNYKTNLRLTETALLIMIMRKFHWIIRIHGKTDKEHMDEKDHTKDQVDDK